MINYEVDYIDKRGNKRNFIVTSTDVRTAMNNAFELRTDCKRIVRCAPKPMFED